MPSFGEGFASAFNPLAGQAANLYIQGKQEETRQQLAQIEQQKANLEGYKGFRDALNTQDPETMKAMWPAYAKSFFNVDPSDAGTKAFYMQAIDKNSQIGQAFRDAFTTMSGDPGDPIAQFMSKVPLQTMSQIGQHPDQLTGMLNMITQQKILTAGQKSASDAIQSTTGGGAPAANTNTPQTPAAPAPAAPPPAAPTAGTTLNSNTTPPPSPAAPAGSLAANQAAAQGGTAPAAPAAAPAPAPAPSAPAPAPAPAQQVPSVNQQPTGMSAATAPAGQGTGQPLPGAAPLPPDLQAKADNLHKQALIVSRYPQNKEIADKLNAIGDKIVSDWNESQKNQSAAIQANAATQRAGAATQQATTDAAKAEQSRRDNTWNVVSSNNGTTITKNLNGKIQATSTDPTTNDYFIKQNAEDVTNQNNAYKAGDEALGTISNINRMRAIDNSGNPPPQGQWANFRTWLGRTADQLGALDLVKSLSASPSSAEVDNATLKTMGVRFAASLKANSSLGSVNPELIDEISNSFPQLTQTPRGRALIEDTMAYDAETKVGISKIWQNHVANQPGYMADANKLTVQNKITNYLTQRSASLGKQLDTALAITKGAPVGPGTGNTGAQKASPQPTVNSPSTGSLGNLSPQGFANAFGAATGGQ